MLRLSAALFRPLGGRGLGGAQRGWLRGLGGEQGTERRVGDLFCANFSTTLPAMDLDGEVEGGVRTRRRKKKKISPEMEVPFRDQVVLWSENTTERVFLHRVIRPATAIQFGAVWGGYPLMLALLDQEISLESLSLNPIFYASGFILLAFRLCFVRGNVQRLFVREGPDPGEKYITMQFETFFGNKKLLEIPASYLQGYCYHNITGIKCRDLETTLYKCVYKEDWEDPTPALFKNGVYFELETEEVPSKTNEKEKKD